MNARSARTVGRSQAGRTGRTQFAAVALVLLASGAAAATAADDEVTPTMVAQADLRSFGYRNRPQFEVTTSSLPRFDNVDGATHTTRIDMTLLPPRRNAVGLSVVISSPAGSSLSGFAPAATGAPAVDFGLHWRYTLDSNYRVDINAWRRMPSDAISLVQSREPSYGARVELPLNAVTNKGLVAERGFVGLQLESGARITVKRSGGKPMLYYRNKF